MNKKKILLLASRPLANDGLTKIEMDVIRNNIDSIDFEVGCCFGFDNKYGDELRQYNIPCHLLPHKSKPIHYMAAIKKLVQTRRYDSVYIHGNSAMMFLEAIPSRIARSHVITHCHNTKSDYPVIHYLMKLLFNLFVNDKIGCSSLASKWAYCGNGIITIPNGIDVNRFIFDAEIRNTVRENLNWKDKKIVGHIGRFNKQKNHIRLINIFEEMHIIDKDVRLLLIGDGELRDDIMNTIKKRGLDIYVKVLDYTDRPEDFMQAMDVMIIPSLFEGLCLVAVEAQANGLPVLIDCAFARETRVTDQAMVFDLKASDIEWAKCALDMLNRGRKDVTKQIYEKRMDQSDMMAAIREILTR